MTDKRIEREIEHGRYLTEHGASDIWNWSSPAGIIRFKRRVAMLSKYLHPGMKVLELLVCENCGEVFLGGYQYIKKGKTYLSVEKPIGNDFVEIYI